jgi:hypothetical protein
MKDQFAEVFRRVERYGFEDGTTELMAGLLFYWMGWMFKPLPLPEVPPGAVILGVILSLFLIAGLKRRYVYPRSGFISARKPGRGEILAALALGLLATLSLLLPIFLFWEAADVGLAWWSLSIGLFLGCLFLWLSVRLGYPRFAVLAGLSAGLGALLSPLFIRGELFYFSSPEIPYWVISPYQIFFPAYFLLMALGLVATGGWAFLRYLHRNPVPAEAPDEQ